MIEVNYVPHESPMMAWEELLAKDGIQNGTAESMETDVPVIPP